ncbi:hypothetical protein CAGGBEG34_520007 [Candidatus Glomeribacter gigasporarum BEG34]|uniref:Uncharacterized protein n=1 Tax=Candidatus Glomeribacter gigasporarum BEG34 TaxID=1070319 RepID=G2JBQ0_9BURK|nr:hypothetical protein CAGGBEG34_520007 [Candidatus Glomeribacter gigasporarum BEG34]
MIVTTGYLHRYYFPLEEDLNLEKDADTVLQKAKVSDDVWIHKNTVSDTGPLSQLEIEYEIIRWED